MYGGMAFAVRDYFEVGLRPPCRASNPDSAEDPLFIYIRDRLIDSFDITGGGFRFLLYMLPSHPDGDEGFVQCGWAGRGRPTGTNSRRSRPISTRGSCRRSDWSRRLGEPRRHRQAPPCARVRVRAERLAGDTMDLRPERGRERPGRASVRYHRHDQRGARPGDRRRRLHDRELEEPQAVPDQRADRRGRGGDRSGGGGDAQTRAPGRVLGRVGRSGVEHVAGFGAGASLGITSVRDIPGRVARPRSPVAVVARTPDHLDVFWIRPDAAIGSTW